MNPTPTQTRYWQRNLRLTGVLLLAWFLITFVAGYFAPELNTIHFLGFPLGFYMFAQGALLAFILIIWVYVRRMERLDREYLAAANPPLSHLGRPFSDD